jgi:hypothetical protein
MAGIKRKMRTIQTVIWDGTNQEVVDDIMSIIDKHNFSLDCKATSRPMSDDRPSTIVIETKMYNHNYGMIRILIERKYPGQCMFDPPLRVA